MSYKDVPLNPFSSLNLTFWKSDWGSESSIEGSDEDSEEREREREEGVRWSRSE